MHPSHRKNSLLREDLKQKHSSTFSEVQSLFRDWKGFFTNHALN